MNFRHALFGEFHFNTSKSFNLMCFKNYSSGRRSKLEILGLSEGASSKEIKAAYLKLSKELHPDVNNSIDAKVKYQQIRDAYDLLQHEVSISTREESQTYHPEERYSQDYSQWRRRNRKQKDFDEWLKDIQREARFRDYKLKMKAKMEKEEKEEKEDQCPIWGKNGSKIVLEVDQNYLDFEKKFISRLDSLMSKLWPSLVKNSQDAGAANYGRKSNTAEDSKDKSEIIFLKSLFLPWFVRRSFASASLVIFALTLSLLGSSSYTFYVLTDIIPRSRALAWRPP